MNLFQRTSICLILMILAVPARGATLTYDFRGEWTTTPAGFVDPDNPDSKTFSGTLIYADPEATPSGRSETRLRFDIFDTGIFNVTFGEIDPILIEARDETSPGGIPGADFVLVGRAKEDGLRDAEPLLPLTGDLVKSVQMFMFEETGTYFPGPNPEVPRELNFSDFDFITVGFNIAEPFGAPEVVGRLTELTRRTDDVAPVPLPGALPLLLGAGIALLLVGRRKP
ncbi:MAG: hypothetical protein AAFV09_01465 [Pseudomonadota bacterium]